MLTFDVYETMTGDKLIGPLSLVSASWASRLESGGRVTGVLDYRNTDERIPRPELHALSHPTGDYTLVVSDPKGVVAAGVITDSVVDDDAGTLTLNGQDLGDVFWPRRLGAHVTNITAAGLSYTNRSPGGAVRRILQRAIDTGVHVARLLPVDVPADGAGTFDLDSKWYELRTMQGLLDEIRKRGYKIHHRPYLDVNGRLRWSTTVAKQITGPTWTFSHGAPQSALSGLVYRRNGQDMVTGAVFAGNGEGSKMLTRSAVASSINSPTLELADTSLKSVKDGTTLQGAADNQLDVNGGPATGLSYTIRPDGEFELSDFVPGCGIEIDIRDHPVIPPGLWRTTVTALSGDVTGLTATPEVEVVEVV